MFRKAPVRHGPRTPSAVDRLRTPRQGCERGYRQQLVSVETVPAADQHVQEKDTQTEQDQDAGSARHLASPRVQLVHVWPT